MPVALTNPSLLLRCDVLVVLQSPQTLHTYHQEVGFRMRRTGLAVEDLGTPQVIGQRSAEVGIFKRAQVLSFGRIRSSNLPRLHRQPGLTKPATIEELFIWVYVSANFTHAEADLAAHTARSLPLADQRVLALWQSPVYHFGGCVKER